MTLNLTERQTRIVYAALYELETRLNRGLANSHLDANTALALRRPSPIHESEVGELRREVIQHVGGDSL